MNAIDGGTIDRAHEVRADVVVVGSGPAGATVARELARAGRSVVVVEGGPLAKKGEFGADSATAMNRFYANAGAATALGRPAMPFVQGEVVGGTSVINGAICWRLPRDVYAEWCAADNEFAAALPWERIERNQNVIDRDLNVAPTAHHVAGPNNTLLAAGAEQLGIEHRPIRRNVRNCVGTGACLQGCPRGNKQSMDVSYLPQAVEAGATLFASSKVYGIRRARTGEVTGVEAGTQAGARLIVHTPKVVLAASAIGSPNLLLRNRIRHGPVGRHFSCHPGASVAGRFKHDVRLWQGATQGHEVTGLRRERLKFEALGYDMAMAAIRVKGVGQDWARGLRALPNWANWGVAVRARSTGRLRSIAGRPVVQFALGTRDVATMRRGVAVLGRLMLAAGAEEVSLGVAGGPKTVSTIAQVDEFEASGSLRAADYQFVSTHLFGTCRMGSDPSTSVVGLDFQHHHVPGLYVADSSVFPSNIGVNPQTAIMTLARCCAQEIARTG